MNKKKKTTKEIGQQMWRDRGVENRFNMVTGLAHFAELKKKELNIIHGEINTPKLGLVKCPERLKWSELLT